MKKLLFLLGILFPFFLQAQEQHHDLEYHWEKGWNKIRIVSYNVLSAPNDKVRGEKLTNWLNQQDAEITGFQELTMSSADFAKAAKEWGHPYTVLLYENKLSIGLSSKQPMEIVKKQKGPHHGFLHVKAYGLNLIVTHLHPGPWKKRLEEADILVDYIRDNKLDSVVVMGDMNSHSPMDADYLENNSSILPLMRGGYKSDNFPNGNFDYFAISRLMSAPLNDAIYQFVPVENRMSFPTRLLMTTSKQDYRVKKRMERIDFLLTSPSINSQVVDGYVFNGPETDYISDHYPIAIDVLVK